MGPGWGAPGNLAEGPPHHLEAGDTGPREEPPRHAGQLTAREHAEDHEPRMELDATPHDQRAREVVLHETPDQDEEREQPRVSESAEQGDRDHGDAGGERTDHGEELERAADRREDERVRD